MNFLTKIRYVGVINILANKKGHKCFNNTIKFYTLSDYIHGMKST